MSELEEILAAQLRDAGISYEREHKAVGGRRYRWDFVVWARNSGGSPILVEVQGGTYMRQRTGHTSASGVKRDCEKNNAAVLAGLRCLYFDKAMIEDGTAIETIKRMVG